MKAAIVLLTVALAVGQAWAGGILAADDPVPGEYIVVLKETELVPVGLAIADERLRDIQGVADDLTMRAGAKRGQVYSEALTGFALVADERTALAMSKDPRVAYVAQNARVQALETHSQINPPSWGLDRLDQRTPQLDGLYTWYETQPASEVHAYILDSGIRATHQDFGGRVDVRDSYSAFDDGNGSQDCHGHGTHVAGIIGGFEHGVAKNVRIHSVRVLDCNAQGKLSTLIAGIDWITRRVLDNPHPAVVNMSLGTRGSEILDDAVKASIAAGVVYVVAAGNSADDACQYSPARVEEVITVGATDRDDLLAPFSSRGDCVDVYAPGTGITSTFNRDDFDTLAMSGTSMAAPHVAGIAVNLLEQHPLDGPEQIRAAILAHAENIVETVDGKPFGRLACSLIDPSLENTIFADGMEPR
ncbi:MAG: S8 family serine peptidase [Xanthomonadales bacterium]|nr:S8 family serine peptidase [Xanthomonadales bacterium]